MVDLSLRGVNRTLDVCNEAIKEEEKMKGKREILAIQPFLRTFLVFSCFSTGSRKVAPLNRSASSLKAQRFRL